MITKRILLVEDEINIRFNIKTMLEIEFYDVVDVQDGSDALIKLEEENYDLVITDIMMNNLGGLELLEHIRTNEKLAQLPVILVTAKPEKEVSDILDDPLNFYLGKPFSFDNLIATVNSALGNN